MNEEIKMLPKNNIDKVLLVISVFLYICSLVPFKEWFILGGGVLSTIFLLISIILQIKNTTKMKFFVIVCLSVSLITDLIFYLSILTIF